MRAGRGRPPMLMTGMVMPQNMAQYYNPNDKNMDGIPDVVQQRMGMMVRCLLPRRAVSCHAPAAPLRPRGCALLRPHQEPPPPAQRRCSRG